MRLTAQGLDAMCLHVRLGCSVTSCVIVRIVSSLWRAWLWPDELLPGFPSTLGMLNAKDMRIA